MGYLVVVFFLFLIGLAIPVFANEQKPVGVTTVDYGIFDFSITRAEIPVENICGPNALLVDGICTPNCGKGTMFHDGLCVVGDTDCQYDIFGKAYCSNEESLFMDGGFGFTITVLMILIPTSVIILIVIMWIKKLRVKES